MPRSKAGSLDHAWFKASTATELLDLYRRVLEEVAIDAQRPLCDFDLRPAADRALQRQADDRRRAARRRLAAALARPGRRHARRDRGDRRRHRDDVPLTRCARHPAGPPSRCARAAPRRHRGPADGAWRRRHHRHAGDRPGRWRLRADGPGPACQPDRRHRRRCGLPHRADQRARARRHRCAGARRPGCPQPRRRHRVAAGRRHAAAGRRMQRGPGLHHLHLRLDRRAQGRGGAAPRHHAPRRLERLPPRRRRPSAGARRDPRVRCGHLRALGRAADRCRDHHPEQGRPARPRAAPGRLGEAPVRHPLPDDGAVQSLRADCAELLGKLDTVLFGGEQVDRPPCAAQAGRRPGTAAACLRPHREHDLQHLARGRRRARGKGRRRCPSARRSRAASATCWIRP